MKKLFLATILIGSVFLVGCQIPTRATGTLAVQKESVTGYSNFDSTQLGHEMVSNLRSTPETHTLIVWNYNDGVNQILVKASEPITIIPGSIGDIYTGYFEEKAGVCYQRDDYINLKKDIGYTMSGVQNNQYAGDQDLWPKDCKPVVPPKNPPPVVSPPQCSEDAFSYHEGHFDGTVPATIIEHMTVKSGFDGIVAYLVSWGVPRLRLLPGDVPLPQTRVYLTTQTLYVGTNVMTAPAASSSLYPSWQWEWSCEPGPEVLTEDNLYSFHYIDGGWGNYGEPQ